ncbi:hypothetical protein RO3G_09430 [Rhizopus delemar RA 99-880]|uniref:Uncharacterized protein n=1 Tax=Rhizopus delemar (strain RA 99-880 / ATCC MYA-4621 / FGSC 9543 / NRRL 43880) TaxID=246409 RepID=I1C8E0_RHIO9|nr:hypothetical protein RO3G_09430 [Rhizopus delemar RA 99-880]|eukprot:EIE84720.1 hypothetical protein RO3G_09430 [Rhizopus delemar RA 99-880]
MCSDSLNQNLSSPLDPLIALGLFLNNRCHSTLDNPKYANLLTTEASSDTAALDNNEENDDFLGIETSEASASDTVAVPV